MQVKLVSSLTRSGTSIGQSDSVVNAVRLRMEEAGNRVLGIPIVYEDLDGGSEETGSWDAERERANALHAVSDPDVLAYVATLDADAAPHSIPITNQAGLLQISPCNTYPGLTRPFKPDEPDKYYPTGKRTYLRTALPDDLQGAFAAHWAKELGAAAAIVLNDTEPFGRGVALPFAHRCRGLGIEVGGRSGSFRSRRSTARSPSGWRQVVRILSSTAASSRTAPVRCGATSALPRLRSR